MRQRFYRTLQVLCILVLVSFFVFRQTSWVVAAEKRYEELQLFARVLNMIQQYYVEPVDTKKLIYGGIKGMLLELDPHTNFLPPDIYKEFETETSGEFGGIGIEITVTDGVLTIIAPIEDTPAWKAGLKAGDKIVSINGESTKGFSLVEAAQRMRGNTGSRIRLGIFREDFKEPKEFEITRARVRIASVKFKDLGEGVGYFRITSFVDGSAKDLDHKLRKYIKDEPKVKGLILDVRNNPGGLLDEAVQISDLFLESGVIVSTAGREADKREVIRAKKSKDIEAYPVIVLINEYSASASEILAGALQENHRAVVMGVRSFGKGSVQSVVKLGDGSGLKLTVARYFTPKGRSIQAEGIEPDIKVDQLDTNWLKKEFAKKEAKREQDIARHLLGENEKANAQQPSAKDNETAELLREDYTVLQAYRYLKAWKSIKKINI